MLDNIKEFSLFISKDCTISQYMDIGTQYPIKPELINTKNKEFISTTSKPSLEKTSSIINKLNKTIDINISETQHQPEEIDDGIVIVKYSYAINFIKNNTIIKTLFFTPCDYIKEKSNHLDELISETIEKIKSTENNHWLTFFLFPKEKNV